MNSIQFVPGAIDAGGCVSNAWGMLKNNYGMYLGIAIVAMLLTGCVPCLNIFILGPIMGGVFFVALKDMRGEPVDFGMMFKGFEKFVPLMVIGLIQSIPGIIAQIAQYGIRFAGMGLGDNNGDFQFFQMSDLAISSGMMILLIVVSIAFMIIGFAWWAVFFFAVPLVIENDLSPVEAIKLSASAAMSNIGGLLVLMIFQFLIVLLGMLMICLGIFLFSIPLIYLANAFAYRQVFPWAGQTFNMAPPPPNAYGSSFGSGM